MPRIDLSFDNSGSVVLGEFLPNFLPSQLSLRERTGAILTFLIHSTGVNSQRPPCSFVVLEERTFCAKSQSTRRSLFCKDSPKAWAACAALRKRRSIFYISGTVSSRKWCGRDGVRALRSGCVHLPLIDGRILQFGQTIGRHVPW
jgi:hypothetical protein